MDAKRNFRTGRYIRNSFFRNGRFLLWILLSFNTVLQSQPTSFMRVYYQSQSNFGTRVCELPDASFIIGGRRYGTPLFQTQLWHLNKYGDTIKVINICGGGVNGLTIDNNFKIKITGASTACLGNAGDVFLTELDTSGTVNFSHTFGTAGIERGEDVLQIDATKYLLACYNNPDPDLYCVDTSGNVIWSRSYGLSGLYRIKRNLEGGYFICGNAGGGFVDPLYVAKIDSIGNVIWYKTFYTNITTFTDIQPTSDSGVVALTDVCQLYKISANGDSVWRRSVYPGTNRIITTSDGNLVFIGAGSIGMSLIKTDTAANVIWSRYFPHFANPSPNNYSNGWDVIETSDGGFLLVGEIDSLGTKNLYVVKTDSIGQVTTGLNNYEPSFSAFCYPQPFREQTTITLSNEQSIGAPNKWILSVYNIQGILLREEPVSGFPYIFKRNNLTSGIYLYTITQAGKIPITGKMVVE